MSMNKLVVLGCAGMAGHIVAEYLESKDDCEVYGVARSEGRFVTHVADVTNFDVLENIFNEIQPDLVINCIGVLVSKSSDDICSAIQINSYLPHYLAKLGKILSFKLVHISTDCVFSGKEGGYREDSFRDGDDNYARTKALGEVINNRDLTIRTSIIGPELKNNGTGLFDWFMKQSVDINGYTEAYWSGVTTLELAKAIYEFIKQDICGLFQLCPDDKISKYDLLKCFSAVWDRKIIINPVSTYIVDKSLVSTRNDFSYSVPDYQCMLEEQRDWMKSRAEYYTHY
ncbi:MAG: SDR family oxidoreductase [Pseudomonadota bacterium]